MLAQEGAKSSSDRCPPKLASRNADYTPEICTNQWLNQWS